MKTFKNLLCFILIAMGWLQAGMLDNFTKAINSYTTKKLNEIKDQANSANPTKTYTNGILTNIDCKVLKNNFYSVCYSSELKNPIYGVSVLFGDLVDKNNIEKRYEFKTDTRLAKYQQATKPRHKITQEAVLIGGILWRMTLLLILRLTL